MVLLSRVEEMIFVDGREFNFACNEYPGVIWPHGHEHLRAFSTEPFPRWAYQGDGWTVEKQLRLILGENTVAISYTLLGGGKGRPLDFEVRPLLALRGIHEVCYQWNGRLATEARGTGHHRVPATGRTPEIFFAHDGAFDRSPNWYLNTIYRRESERGYAGLEDLWAPGVIRYKLSPGQPVHFACSADPFDLEQVVSRSSRQYVPMSAGLEMPDSASVPTAPAADPAFATLVRAADAFVLTTPQGDSLGAAAQYHWSPPSPRSALVAFAGLFLVPRRFLDARSLLVAVAGQLDGGLIPSVLPEDGSAPFYGGADVALWFVNAVHQYLAYTGDDDTLRRHLAASVFQVIDSYQRGTKLGIKVDDDGLLFSGEEGIPATWMNSKIGDWVVTPRQGLAVEINALWYNALCGAAEIALRVDNAARADQLGAAARSVKEAFNRRFWNDAAGCCYDALAPTLDGATPAVADASIRPNQLLAMTLPHPVLAEERQPAVLEKVRAELLTPYGVRTLSPRDSNYQGRYAGNVAARDRAYHNGSAFPWLLGPLVTATLRVRGRGEAAQAEARALIEHCLARLQGDGMGQLCELFDGDAPHAAGGAVASPLSIGELLRCYAQDVLDQAPSPPAPAATDCAPCEVSPEVTPPPAGVPNPT
jgi:predicted glycogen debranching enzyme